MPRRWLLSGTPAAGVLAAAFAAWIFLPDLSAFDSDEPLELGRPRLSIAVLPFKNMSDDASQDYFADALTEDLAADLSRICGSFVISRCTAAIYRDQNIDTKGIATDLNVRYLLEGTARRTKLDVRVNVQLTDGRTGQEIWSDRYEKAVGDIYAFQSDVTGRVARTLNLELKEAVSRQRVFGGTGNTDSKDLALRVWAEIWYKLQTPATNQAGLEYIRRARA